MSKWPVRIGVGVALALVVAFVIARAAGLIDDASSWPSLQQPWFVGASLAAYGLGIVVYALIWREIVCRLDRTRPPIVDSLAVFCASWLGRYVPTGLPYIAGKVVLGQRLGHRTTSLATSMLYENVIIGCVGGALGASFTLLFLRGDSSPLLLIAAAGLAAASLAALTPRLLRGVLRFAARVTRHPAIAGADLLSNRDVMATAALAAMAVVLQGTAYAAMVAAFTDVSTRELVLSGAIFALAGAAGIAVLPAPGGLGVREAVLIGLTQVYLPLEVAAAAAVAVRLGGLAVEAGLGGAGALVLLLRERRRAAVTLVEQRPLDTAA